MRQSFDSLDHTWDKIAQGKQRILNQSDGAGLSVSNKEYRITKWIPAPLITQVSIVVGCRRFFRCGGVEKSRVFFRRKSDKIQAISPFLIRIDL